MGPEERSTQEELAVSLLDAGMSVNISGLRGSGRSSMIASVSERVRNAGHRVVEINGVRAFTDGPFAALALAGVDIPPGKSASATAAELTSVVARMLGIPGTVLAIDDADDLDRPSVGVLVAAALRSKAVLLAGTRPSGLREGELDGFNAQLGAGTRLRLGPLRHEAVHTIVLNLLGGPVETETLTMITVESGGLPGLVRSIVRVGAITKRIVQRDGLWTSVGDLWDPLLGQSLEPLLVDLAPDVLGGLEALAWAGVVSLNAAIALTGESVLASLDDAGLTQMLHLGGESFVGVYPPLLAEHLRRDAPPVHRALASARADAVTGGIVASGHGDGGAERLFGQRFREHWRGELVSRRAAWERAPSPATANPLLQALHELAGDAEDAAEVFDRTPSEIGTASDRAVFAGMHGVLLGATYDDLDGAVAVLARAAEALPSEAGYLRAVSAHLGFIQGRMPVESELVPGPLDSDASIAALAAARAEALLAQGRTEEARRIVERFPSGDDGWFRVNMELSQSLLLAFEARFADAVPYSRALLQKAREQLEGAGIEAHSYALSLALTYSGRIEVLGSHLESVLSLINVSSLQRHLRQGSLTLASLDAFRRGRGPHARSLGEQSQALGTRPGPFPGMEPPSGVWALLEVDEESRAAAVEAMWKLVVDHIERGYMMYGVPVGVWIVEQWPTPERLDAVIGWAGSVQSTLLRALGEYAQCIRKGDSRSMLDVAAHLERIDMGLHALRARIAAARLARQEGDVRLALQITTDAWELRKRTGIGFFALFASLAADVDFTAREWQLARLVGEGASNARIADVLVLSVRTVENHLSNMFRKVGAQGREELADAVATWLVEP